MLLANSTEVGEVCRLALSISPTFTSSDSNTLRASRPKGRVLSGIHQLPLPAVEAPRNTQLDLSIGGSEPFLLPPLPRKRELTSKPVGEAMSPTAFSLLPHLWRSQTTSLLQTYKRPPQAPS